MKLKSGLFARTLVGVLLLALLLQAGVSPADEPLRFEVDSVVDGPDAVPGDGSCADAEGRCTLRAAIEEAAATGRALELDLAPGRYVLDAPIEVTVPLLLRGASAAAVTVAAGPALQGRVLLKLAGGGAWNGLSGLTIDGAGRAGVVTTARGVPLRVEQAVIRNGKGHEGGAGILANGPLAVIRSSVIDNELESAGGRGGGILVQGAPGWLTQTTLSGNKGRHSGGVFARGAEFRIEHSSLVGNVGGPVGGYQENPHSSLQIVGSWLGENQVPKGDPGLDCRSVPRDGSTTRSGGYNVLGVTGPTGKDLVGTTWTDTWQFACTFDGPGDRVGTRDEPLSGPWRRVTDPTTGLVGVEALPGHPAHRMIPAGACPEADAWGRPRPADEDCDAGALRNPEAAPVASEPALARPGYLWLWTLGAFALVLWLWRRRRRRPAET